MRRGAVLSYRIFLRPLIFTALIAGLSHPAIAELRKRVLIDVRADNPAATKVISGAIARELDRHRDILVIDDRFEQTFLPYMKYKSHVIVQVDVVQMYAAESTGHPWMSRSRWKKVPSLMAASAVYPVMGLSILSLPFVNEDDPPTVTEGHFVANVALFDMSTERSFARTQTAFSFTASNVPAGPANRRMTSSDDVILTQVAAKGFREAAKWIRKETKRRPGQTWVFAQSSGRAFVNAGSLDGIKPGQHLKIYRPCNIYAPGTNTVVGRATTYEGDIRIVHVDELFSIAEPVKFSLSGEYITKQ